MTALAEKFSTYGLAMAKFQVLIIRQIDIHVPKCAIQQPYSKDSMDKDASSRQEMIQITITDVGASNIAEASKTMVESSSIIRIIGAGVTTCMDWDLEDGAPADTMAPPICAVDTSQRQLGIMDSDTLTTSKEKLKLHHGQGIWTETLDRRRYSMS
jgi:hypothetical protein